MSTYKEIWEKYQRSHAITEEHQKFLETNYPGWFTRREGDKYWYGPLQCDDGWFELIKDLCEKIKSLAPQDFQVFQVKEKFGGLRFYTSSLIHPMENLINEAELKSFSICEHCGKEGHKVVLPNSRWVKTYCDNCLEEERKYREYEKSQSK